MLYDVSQLIRTGMPVYPGDPPVFVERVSDLSAGDLFNLSRIECGTHTGTHVDAPRHFLADGAGVDSLPLDSLIGPAVVVDATSLSGSIGESSLSALGIANDTARVLFKTTRADVNGEAGSSSDALEEVWLSEAAARLLIARGIRLVGIDRPSVASFDDPAPTHRALLTAGVVIVEGLDLRGIAPGRYRMFCLPLPIELGDGAPARMILEAMGDTERSQD